MRRRLILPALLALSVTASAVLWAGDAAKKPVLRVVFFTPADVEPPEGVRERIKEHVDYSQAFFARWMKHWGKAAIHELGHALGLPHIGPRESDKLGNSLMGPITPVYRKKYPRETRVYLSQAAAAMLWKHPLFSGTVKGREKTPALRCADLTATYNSDDSRMSVSGHVDTDESAHSIVIGCESKSTRNGYWRRTFVGRVAENGSFQVKNDAAEARGRVVNAGDHRLPRRLHYHRPGAKQRLIGVSVTCLVLAGYSWRGRLPAYQLHAD